MCACVSECVCMYECRHVCLTVQVLCASAREFVCMYMKVSERVCTRMRACVRSCVHVHIHVLTFAFCWQSQIGIFARMLITRSTAPT